MRAILISAGAIVWALHFTLLYGFTSLACARGFPGAVPWAAGAATLAAAGALVVLLVAAFPRRAEFNGWMAMAVAALALVAIAFETVPLFIVPACA